MSCDCGRQLETFAATFPDGETLIEELCPLCDFNGPEAIEKARTLIKGFPVAPDWWEQDAGDKKINPFDLLPKEPYTVTVSTTSNSTTPYLTDAWKEKQDEN